MAALAEAVSKDRDDIVRQSAVEALAKIGGDEAVGPLSWALREDPESFVRYEALVKLAEIGGDAVTASLLQALTDPKELVWAKAEEILEMHGAGGHEP